MTVRDEERAELDSYLAQLASTGRATPRQGALLSGALRQVIEREPSARLPVVGFLGHGVINLEWHFSDVAVFLTVEPNGGVSWVYSHEGGDYGGSEKTLREVPEEFLALAPRLRPPGQAT